MMNVPSMDLVHDLRVPVQLILSCVQLLEDEIQADAKTKACLRTLARSADEMRGMIDHALESEMLRAGRRDVVAEARKIAGEFSLLGKRRGIQVDFSANASRFSMQTDAEKLRRILNNLLSNALRCTPSGGRIRLDVRLLGDSVEFSVTDNGCGIEKSRQERIFEPGVSDSGGGRGLTIVKKYAGMLGGSVGLESAPGRGSRFTLRLPVK